MSQVAAGRPELRAHEHAVRADFPVVARELRDVLTARLVAYVGGVSETRAVHAWVSGGRQARAAVEERLRFTLQVALMIAEADSPEVAQAWFQDLNPQLEDRSPARLIREGEIDEVGPQVMAAARAFVTGG